MALKPSRPSIKVSSVRPGPILAPNMRWRGDTVNKCTNAYTAKVSEWTTRNTSARNTLVQLLALYANPENHHAQRHRQTQTDGRQDSANSRSYCVSVRSAIINESVQYIRLKDKGGLPALHTASNSTTEWVH